MAEPSKLLAEWFWTDRWMGSSAFLLPIGPRGLYREMLTQAWRRGGRLPNNHEVIRRATGCTLQEWNRCWPSVQGYWRVDGDSLVNDTQLEVYAEAVGIQQRASERGKKGAQARAQALAQAHAQAQPNQPLKIQPPSPSPSPLNQKKSFSCDGMGPDERIRTIAYQLREIYPEVYAAERAGAVYRTTIKTEERDNPNYYAAAEMHPDINRLRRLLEVFLTRPMGDKSSPGTPGQFVHMLPECDEVLRRSGWKATA